MPHATDEEQQTSGGRSISSAVATSSQTNTGSTVAFTTSQTASSDNEFASEAQVSYDCRRPFGVKERGGTHSESSYRGVRPFMIVYQMLNGRRSTKVPTVGGNNDEGYYTYYRRS